MKKLLIGILLFFVGYNTKAQEVQNVKIDFKEGIISLTFDLSPQKSLRERYNLEITSSKDNYTNPVPVLNNSTENIEPKKGLQYQIDALKNFEGFRGDLNFKIKAVFAYSLLEFITPSEIASLKKGKSLQLSWIGGLENDKYSLELYKQGAKVSTLQSMLTRKVTSWDMAKDTKAGSGYMIKVVSEKNKQLSAFTQSFKIKRKIPIVIKILPFAIAGGVFAIISGKSSEGTTTKTDLPGLPDPPN